ncbi:hypothetical protein FSW04_21170 [Baekduia soli]|uniref:Uncharacterized protein n=1 Tax=Baekduia soli TaxID=496014 RepID=A0A5B8UAK0_9ACTN|nr:hypothetical protein [Baekduia soli]QEC49828.1 hypothetical protein FSW04_21170 [Baekduia soli]
MTAHASAAGRLALRMLVENENEDGSQPVLQLAGEASHAAEAGRLARDLGARFLILHDALLLGGRLGPLPAECALVVLGLERHPAAGAAARARGARHYVLWDRAGEDLPRILRGEGQPAPATGA